jgi:dipeptidyl aminopeptidase/acylaminoacyl peptidase
MVRTTRRSPPNVWTIHDCAEPVMVTDLRPELASIAFGSQEPISWEGVDGQRLDGLLVLPPGRSVDDGPFPLVTQVHGGPYFRWPDALQVDWSDWGQWLAQDGYAVFLPNPRGGLGHGSAFADTVAGEVGQADWQDILAGIDRLVGDGIGDPGRLGICGWSQGGFMTAWAVGQTDRFRFGIMGAGVSDWGMMVAESDLPHFEAMLGGSTGWEGLGPHRHDALSPVSYVHRVHTPVLILHGEQDERVPVSQGRFFARGLREYGIPVELVTYPREPHAIRERNHQLDLLQRVRSWAARWIAS